MYESVKLALERATQVRILVPAPMKLIKLFFIAIVIFGFFFGLGLLFIYLNIFDINKRIECIAFNKKYVLEECSWPSFNCEQKGTCMNVYGDGGKECNSGNQCSSKKCVVENSGIAEFEKQLGKTIYETPNWIDKVTIPSFPIGHCRKDERDGSCLSFFVYIDENNKVVNPRCVR